MGFEGPAADLEQLHDVVDAIINLGLIQAAQLREVSNVLPGGQLRVVGQGGADSDGDRVDLGGRLVSPGFIETHIHLDKSCILERCKAERGDLEEAIAEVTRAKAEFTPEDVYTRAKRTLEKCISNGTTHMRTQLEVDPGIGLRGLEGVLPLIEEYRWAIDIEIWSRARR